MLPLPLCAALLEGGNGNSFRRRFSSEESSRKKKSGKKANQEVWVVLGRKWRQKHCSFPIFIANKSALHAKTFPHPLACCDFHRQNDGAFCVTRFLINFEIKLFRRYPRSNVSVCGVSTVYNPRHILCTTRHHHHHHHRMNLISFQNSFI